MDCKMKPMRALLRQLLPTAVCCYWLFSIDTTTSLASVKSFPARYNYNIRKSCTLNAVIRYHCCHQVHHDPASLLASSKINGWERFSALGFLRNRKIVSGRYGKSQHSPSRFFSVSSLSESIVEPPSSKIERTVHQLLLCVNEEIKDTLLIGELVNILEEPYIAETTVSQEHWNDTTLDNIDTNRFNKLVGLYEVKYVKPTKEGDNPVGGKWTRKGSIAQKLLLTRRLYQHILPPNATGFGKTQYSAEPKSKNTRDNNDNDNNVATVVGEAINVIVLDALWKLFQVTIILRGDAIPLTKEERTIGNSTSNTLEQKRQQLSSFAVRALFDPPRIVISNRRKNKLRTLINMSIGPKSSVVLDTSYIDSTVLRIGVGGRSGTRFLFQRCSDDQLEEANEFQLYLQQQRKLWNNKWITAFGLFSIASVSGMSTTILRPTSTSIVLRLLSIFVSVVSSLLAVAITFSSGGIEQDAQSVQQRKRFDDNKITTTNSGR